jgi:hypothetical protein
LCPSQRGLKSVAGQNSASVSVRSDSIVWRDWPVYNPSRSVKASGKDGPFDPSGSMINRRNSQPACPVSDEERAWIEGGVGFLAREFGWDRVRLATVVLPLPEYFPDPFAGKADDALPLFERVCRYMGVSSRTVELCFYRDTNPIHTGRQRQGTAGLYEEHQGAYRIWIEESNLADPLGLVATMAHELGHVLLLGERRVSVNHEDHEPLTDLLTVFFGLGVFTANSALRENYWTTGNSSGWSIGRHGYLTMSMHGYALALFAHVRDEIDPEWAKELRLDVRTAFQQGVRYLQDAPEPEFRPLELRMETPAAIPVQSDVPRCTYCGVQIDPHLAWESDSTNEPELDDQASTRPDQRRQQLGICLECRDSLDENTREVLDEERSIRTGQTIFKYGCLTVVAIFVVVLILGLLGII